MIEIIDVRAVYEDGRAMKRFSILLCVALAGCATTFRGDPYFPDGSKGCARECKSRGLTMGAFVLAGEYSTACVCVPVEHAGKLSGGALGMAAVGVITQMRAAQEQQQAAAGH